MRRKKSFLKRHKKLRAVLIVLTALFLVVCGLMASVVWSLQKDKVTTVKREQLDSTASNVSIVEKERKADDVFNVMLVGTDTRDPDSEMGRSDSMMVVSYNRTQQKATVLSFLRDSLVDIEGYGQSKLGHTFAYGGVGLTINTINDTYDLDVQNYITISFDNLVNVIDEIGGVEVYISAEEAEYYRQCGMPNITEGDNVLTGSQALAHARNRTIGYDFERTRRQRSVLYGVYKKIMSEKDPKTILPLITYCMTQVDTNMSVTEIYDLATEILGTENLEVQQSGIPCSGTYEDATFEGMSVLKVDFEANKEYLQDLLY